MDLKWKILQLNELTGTKDNWYGDILTRKNKKKKKKNPYIAISLRSFHLGGVSL